MRCLVIFLLSIFMCGAVSAKGEPPGDLDRLSACLIQVNNTGDSEVLNSCAYPLLNKMVNTLTNNAESNWNKVDQKKIKVIKKLQDDCLIKSTKSITATTLKKEQFFCEFVFTNMLLEELN